MVEVTDFIDQVFAQDFSKASPTFNELIGDKMSAALEAEKIQVASRVFDAAADAMEDDNSDEED